MDVSALADLIVDTGVPETRKEVVACLEQFLPDSRGQLGYLAWRYATIQTRLSDGFRSETLEDQLGAIARLVDSERVLIDGIVDRHETAFDEPELAKRMINQEWRELFDQDDFGRSAADELRRVRAKDRFLRRGVVLSLATGQTEMVLKALSRLHPPEKARLAEVTPALLSAIDLLESRIEAVARLFTTDSRALNRLYKRSFSDLRDLRNGRFDFLRAFYEFGSTQTSSSRQVIHGLPFEILPQGEQLRAFLEGMRSTGLYSGYQVDQNRLTVLEELEAYFGAKRCEWYAGSEWSRGVNNEYLVLAIKAKPRAKAKFRAKAKSRAKSEVREDAVAISPLAGQHATYIVRHDCAKAHWARVFANPKAEARLLGARRLLFTSPIYRDGDPYTAMRDKIIALLECDPNDFNGRLVFDEYEDGYRMS